MLNIQVRSGKTTDIPFLAQIQQIAFTSPYPESVWDGLLRETNTSTLQFLEAVLTTNASNWGNVEDFIILEQDRQAIAACTLYQPQPDPGDRRMLKLECLPEIAKLLQWSEQIREELRNETQSF